MLGCQTFGKNDIISCIRTHLGPLLNPGDYALGYDLYVANFDNREAEECKNLFADAVLVKKTSLEDGLRTSSRDLTVKRTIDGDYEKFLRDMEVNLE